MQHSQTMDTQSNKTKHVNTIKYNNYMLIKQINKL